jgi:hypothetical protein
VVVPDGVFSLLPSDLVAPQGIVKGWRE